MKHLFLIIFIMTFTIKIGAADEKKSSGKVQRLDFSDTDVNGKVRSPDGSYLVQKRGMDFAPMYKVKKKINENVQDSLGYIH